MGIKLEDYRIKHDIDQDVFAKQLGVSVPTFARIAAAERDGKQYRMTKRKAEKFLAKIAEELGHEVTMDDLDGVTYAPPRPGRPKKVSDKA